MHGHQLAACRRQDCSRLRLDPELARELLKVIEEELVPRQEWPR